MYRFIISELHYNNDAIIIADDNPPEDDNAAGWTEKHKWLIGPYTITEWRSDRNHLEVEGIVPDGEDPIPAQRMMLEIYATLPH